MNNLTNKLSTISRCVLLTLISILGLIAIIATGGGGGSGGGGGGGGGTAQTITMTEYFPLSSGWVTDDWTLFIDILDHDVNGISTKAMVDTGNMPSVYYWTNDADGLRLHKIERYDALGTAGKPFDLKFSPPIKFADAQCDVGSIQSGTVSVTENGNTFDADFSCEFLGFENVSTPDGTINCAKFRIKGYPSEEPSANFGYETIWLGNNIGFVKSESDANAGFTLFVWQGESRLVQSYHLTPATTSMSQDEIDVRNAYKLIEEYARQKDLTNFMTMIDTSYLDSRCRDKTKFETFASGFWNDSTENWDFVSIEEVLFSGPDDAYVVREYVNCYKMNNEYERDWSRFRHHFKKQAGGSWKLYGNQNKIYHSFLSVYPRRTPSETKLIIGAVFLDCATDLPIQDGTDIPFLEVNGPPGSNLNNYKPPWIAGNEKYFWGKEDISKAVKGYYTFEWTDKYGSSLLVTDYLSTTQLLPIPVLTSPINDVALNSGIVDFQWGPVVGANEYLVEIYDFATGDRILSAEVPINNYTNTNDPLTPGSVYQWRVRAYINDQYGNRDSESRCDKAKFSINPP